MKISLSFYTLEFNTIRKTSDLKKWDELTGPFENAIDAINDYIGTIEEYDKKTAYTDDSKLAEKKIFKEDVESKKDYIYGKIRAGETGISSEIYNPKAKDAKLAYTRGINDIELIPLYFYICGEHLSKRIIIATQNFANRGLAGTFVKNLKNHLSELYAGSYTVKIQSIHLGPIYFEPLITGGEIKELELLRFVAPTDAAEAKKGGNENKFSLHQIIKPSRGKSIPYSIKKVIQDSYNKIVDKEKNQEAIKEITASINEALSMDIDDITAIQDISVKFDLYGTTRKIDLGNFERFATRYDVSDNVVKVKNSSHPTIESIHTQAQDIIKTHILKLITR